ncbi:MAG: hypothetical protein GPJ54_00955 [Candidatus Heimdallarchaeota archaeon]|nr:hypothetical protein [Candidatus Heimdallarchaeota archaeon]
MRTILILPAGMLVIGIMLSGIVLDSNLPFLLNNDNTEDTNLTPEEAISIAVKEPSASIFVRQTQAVVETNYETGLWTVRFTDINQNTNYIQVEIDDQTQLIIDTETATETVNHESQFANRDALGSSSPDQQIAIEDIAIRAPSQRYGLTDDYFYVGNQEQVNAAIEYFIQNEMIGDYIDENSIEFYGYSYDDTVYLWGYSTETYEEWMGAILLAVELTEDSWEFSILEISASFDFGNLNYSLAEAINLAKTTDEFKLFEENITDYSINSILHYYADEYQGKEGFVYNIYFSSYSFMDDNEYVVAVDPVTTFDSTEEDESSSSQGGDTDSIYYCGDFNWIDVEISDSLWNVLEVWGPNSAILSSEEAIEKILEDPTIKDWNLQVGLITSYTYYSGYGMWSVWMASDEDPYNYASANLNDRTGKVTDVRTFLSVEAILNEQIVNSIIQETEEADEFFDTVDNYEFYINYDNYGVWYFSYFDNENYHNYIWGSLNDTDSTVTNIEVRLYQEPNLSEAEVLATLSNSDIDDFKTKYPDTVIYFYYDGYGTWYVSGNSLTLVEAWFWAQVDDESSNVIIYQENHPKVLPIMDIEDVLGIAHSTTEFKDINDETLQKFEYYYFIDGTWFYYLQGTSDNNTYYWLSISIDDETGEISDLWSSSWNYSDDYYTDPDDTNKDGDEIVTVVAP